MRKYWLLAVPILALLLWWGFDHGDSVPQIHFATVTKTTIQSTVPTNGKVEPASWAASRAETAGVVTAVSVQRGQQVKAGQTLVRLDISSAQSSLAAALAAEEEARAQTSTLARGGKEAAIADLENRMKTARSAVDVAQRAYDSDLRLEKQQAVTRLQTQQAKDELERAKLQLASLEDQRRTLVTSSDRAVAQAKLHDAEAAVALARHRVALGEIKAPLSGTLYQFDIKVGAYLQIGDLVGLIGNLDQMKVTVYVDEPDLGRVSLGVPVNITWDARPGQVWSGHVDKLPTEVVALGTRTVGEVNTIVDNPNHDLLPGVTVNVTIVSKIVNDAITIPKAALRTVRGNSGVYKLSGKQIVWTPIKAGVSDVNNVQVISGLAVGERVADRVVEPADAELNDGMRVKASVD